ncbi:MAG TPA: DUF192 domain-containing protein [Thermoanaerobaculia bacterium]|nr:DUF192 domain-containing protein [Thermoanaerobaculia bacterium]
MSGRLLTATALAALVSACGAAPGTATGTSSATPTPAAAASSAASGPRAEMPSGAVYRLELALTPEEQAQGLMYRENLPDRTGMIFVFDQAGDHHFWMKNTMIPLDMIWMDESGKVIFVSANTPPCKADPCPTYGPNAPARQVLEIAGGMAAKEKVTVGSTLRLIEVPLKR